MGKPFFTKKQKAKMRERRKKKKMQNKNTQQDDDKIDNAPRSTTTLTAVSEPIQEEIPNVFTTENSSDSTTVNSSGKKRPRSLENLDVLVDASPIKEELVYKTMNGNLYVKLPENLSSKDAKKFRKDSRRKLREENKSQDDVEIEFVSEKDMPSFFQTPSKKRKKEFPCIKELLKQKRQMEELQEEQAKLQEKLNSIPENVRAQYIALDCEMVGIGTEGRKSALARVSMVDWNYNVILDTYVQVPIRVTDFRTHVSGVEPKHIKDRNAMDVKQCRELVAKLLKGKILVGHALTNDLKALMLTHSKSMIRDTAKYRPFQRYGNGKWRARKLRDLVKENLKGKEDFQEGEHDSVKDAKATMELFQLVFSQWEKEIANKSKK